MKFLSRLGNDSRKVINLRFSLSSTSTRTFVAIPAVVIAEQLISGRRIRFKYGVLLLWGYLQYRLSGEYRIKRAGGPSGMSQGFPDEIVTDGIYGITRNPMYLGHMIFLGGLVLMTRSPISMAIFSSLLPWYNKRARADEERLVKKFGPDYETYKHAVPRWIPVPKAIQEKLSELVA